MGAETLAIAAIAASTVASAGSAIYSANQTKKVNQQAIDASKEAATTAYERQNEQYEKYQSPSAMAKQLASIGVNPANALSQISGGSPSSVPQASIPSLSPPQLDFSQLTNNAIAAANQIQDRQLKQSQMKEILSRVNKNEVDTTYQSLYNDFFSKYGDKEWSEKLRNMVADTYLKYSTGAVNEADFDLKNVLRLVQNEEFGMKKEEAAQFAMYLGKMLQVLQSQANLNNSSALKASEEASTIKALRPYQTEASYLANSISRVDQRIKLVTQPEAIAEMYSRLEADKSINDAKKAQALQELAKLQRILRSYEKNPSKVAVDATLQNFNQHFPILSQLSSLAVLK